MRLQHGGNSNPRGYCGQRTDQNGTREDQSSEGIENTQKSKRRGEFPGLCKFLQMLYPKLQPYRQTTK